MSYIVVTIVESVALFHRIEVLISNGALLISVVCLVPPAVVCVDVSGLYPPRQEQNPFLKWWHLHRKFCYPYQRVIMMTKAGTGDLQLNVSCIKVQSVTQKSYWGSDSEPSV
jgi:hypothetical protein